MLTLSEIDVVVTWDCLCMLSMPRHAYASVSYVGNAYHLKVICCIESGQPLTLAMICEQNTYFDYVDYKNIRIPGKYKE